MNSDQAFNLEAFVEQFFICQGAAIEKKGHRLDVLAPPELARQIGIPELCSLTIGSEDSDGYGIHYGAPLLEKIAATACDRVPLVGLRLAFHYLKSQGFDRLIDEWFTFRGAIVQVGKSAEVLTEYLLLTCRYLAQSDEQKEGLMPLAFNLETGAPVGPIETMLDAAEKQVEAGKTSTAIEAQQVERIIQWVQRRAPRMIEAQIEPFRDSMNRRFRRDVANLEEYYTELKQEMTDNLMRSGLSEGLIQERKEKISLIPNEMAKKKDDLFKKYSIKVKLALTGAMLIRTPAVKLFCRATVGRRKKPLTIVYNPIDKSLDPLVCDGCGDGTYAVQFCDGLHVLCAAWARKCPVCGL
ncbi:MAG: hypothetical protein WBY88_06270 [Desulfosarcina sp.]